MKQQPITIYDGFPHTDRKYMCEICCCGVVHAQTGAQRVGIFMGAMLIIQILNTILGDGVNFGSLIFLFIEAFITILLFIGIRQMNPHLVMPYVIFTFLGVLSVIFGTFIIVMTMLFPLSIFGDYIRKHMPDEKLRGTSDEEITFLRIVCFIALIVCALGLLLNFWFFSIIKRCYTYLRDFEDYQKVNGGSVEVQGLAQP